YHRTGPLSDNPNALPSSLSRRASLQSWQSPPTTYKSFYVSAADTLSGTYGLQICSSATTNPLGTRSVGTCTLYGGCSCTPLYRLCCILLSCLRRRWRFPAEPRFVL